MTAPNPTIKSFVAFTDKLSDALRRICDWQKQMPDDTSLVNIRRQLEATQQWTSGGKRPADEQRARLNFGWVAAREVDPFDDQLSRDLSALSQYLHRWPPGVVAPGWP